MLVRLREGIYVNANRIEFDTGPTALMWIGPGAFLQVFGPDAVRLQEEVERVAFVPDFSPKLVDHLTHNPEAGKEAPAPNTVA